MRDIVSYLIRRISTYKLPYPYNIMLSNKQCMKTKEAYKYSQNIKIIIIIKKLKSSSVSNGS